MEVVKAFQVRLNKDLWKFLKKESINQEKSMNHIIESLILKYKEEKKLKNQLT